jgi:hypothetical protein
MDASQPWRKTLELINNEMTAGHYILGMFHQALRGTARHQGPFYKVRPHSYVYIYIYDGYILYGYIWWLYIYKYDGLKEWMLWLYPYILQKTSIYIYKSMVISSKKINKSSPSDLHHTSALNPANSRKPHRTTTSGCQNSGRNLGTSVPEKEHFQYT